ncbi:unnamed protein product, partial [Plutella xylostella]
MLSLRKSTLIICIVMCKMVISLRCYQCSSQKDSGCFSHNLNKDHLKDCASNNAVCRTISQVQYFLPNQDVLVIRECASIYGEQLNCTQSEWSDVHKSIGCECDVDACNTARGSH